MNIVEEYINLWEMRYRNLLMDGETEGLNYIKDFIEHLKIIKQKLPNQ